MADRRWRVGTREHASKIFMGSGSEENGVEALRST